MTSYLRSTYQFLNFLAVSGPGVYHAWGSFNNYVDKKRIEKGVSRKSMFAHATKGRNHVKCSQMSTRGEEWVKIW